MKVAPFVCLGFAAVIGSILQKIMSTRIVLGLPQYAPHYFHKPWFVTTYMFFAMFLSLAIYGIQRLKAKGKKNTDMTFNKMCFCGLPAFCDLLVTVLQVVSFLYLGVSISLSVQFSKIIFSAILAKFALHQVLLPHHLIAITVIMVSLVFVSCATILGTGTPLVKASAVARLLAILAKLFAHFLESAKAALEEHIMHVDKVESMLLLGIEGIWGLVACVFVFVPIASTLPPTVPVGFFEDTRDTIAMLKNSPVLLGLVFFDVGFILFLNVFHMIAIDVTSALFEAIFRTVQSAVVWITQLILYYSLVGTRFDEWKILGEPWTKWSFMQLAGFLLAGFGVLVYNDVFRWAKRSQKGGGYTLIPSADR